MVICSLYMHILFVFADPQCTIRLQCMFYWCDKNIIELRILQWYQFVALWNVILLNVLFVSFFSWVFLVTIFQSKIRWTAKVCKHWLKEPLLAWHFNSDWRVVLCITPRSSARVLKLCRVTGVVQRFIINCKFKRFIYLQKITLDLQ